MKEKNTECLKSLTGNHEWVYPKMEPSIDSERSVSMPYCKHCLVGMTPEEKEAEDAFWEKTQRKFLDYHSNFWGIH